MSAMLLIAPNAVMVLVRCSRGMAIRTLCSVITCALQGAIMDAMAGYLLDVRSVRREVDRREACGQWVAGSSGEGGAFAMRTPEEKARRAAAGSDDEVCISPLPCPSTPCFAHASQEAVPGSSRPGIQVLLLAFWYHDTSPSQCAATVSSCRLSVPTAMGHRY